MDGELEVATPHGPARAFVSPPAEATRPPRGALLLGHGAGGGVGAADLVRAAAVARAAGLAVALVEQPYRVAGRRSAAPAPQLDVAWLSVVDALRAGPFAGLPLVCGGRSSGARVACRTAAQAGAAAVLCLAFPLRPAGRTKAGELRPSRLGELEAVPTGVPVLVVQGSGDPFGMPPAAPGREVVAVPGTHAFRAAGLRELEHAAADWLRAVLDPVEPLNGR